MSMIDTLTQSLAGSSGVGAWFSNGASASAAAGHQNAVKAVTAADTAANGADAATDADSGQGAGVSGNAAQNRQFANNPTLGSYIDSLLNSATDALGGNLASLGNFSGSVSAQINIEYQSLRLLSDATGSTLTQESFQFSFSATFEFLASSQSTQNPFESFNMDSVIADMQDLFSPENTAQRIADFALAQYKPSGEGDTEETRTDFISYIGEFVQKGFDEAARILGYLPDEIAAGVDQTHELVFGAFDDFISNGLAANQDERTSNVMAFYEAFNQNISITETTGRQFTYNLYGQPAGNSKNQGSSLDTVA